MLKDFCGVAVTVEFRLPAQQIRAILVRMFRTQDLRVKEIVRLLTPRELKAQSPTPVAVNAMVAHSRERIIRILRQEDPRPLVVIGPCSIHEEKSALEYATRYDGNRDARLF
jgi:3-deoxy-7-phosphoheptulonate synthase